MDGYKYQDFSWNKIVGKCQCYKTNAKKARQANALAVDTVM